jgi:hypothetical protein
MPFLEVFIMAFYDTALQLSIFSMPARSARSMRRLPRLSVNAPMLSSWPGDAFFINRSVQLTTLVSRDRIATVYIELDFPAAGGLMSYGTGLADAWR